MRRVLALAAFTLTGTAGSAVGQPPGPPGGAVGPTVRPPFSPYLNLARGGSSPAVSYYGIVRPLQQQGGAIQTLQQAATLPNPFTSGATTGDGQLVTGNPYGFQNYRLYFQNQFVGATFGSGPGAQPGTPRGAGAVPPGGQRGVTPPPRRR